MSRLIKAMIGILVALIVVLPALLLVVAIVLVSLVLAGGLTVVSVGGSLALLLLLLLGGVGLCGALLVAGWFVHLHHATLHFQDHGQKRTLTITIDLTGRQLYRQLFTETRLRHQSGAKWGVAFEQAAAGFFNDELRDYILHQVGEQYGLDVAEAMSLADDQAYHFSL